MQLGKSYITSRLSTSKLFFSSWLVSSSSGRTFAIGSSCNPQPIFELHWFLQTMSREVWIFQANFAQSMYRFLAPSFKLWDVRGRGSDLLWCSTRLFLNVTRIPIIWRLHRREPFCWLDSYEAHLLKEQEP